MPTFRTHSNVGIRHREVILRGGTIRRVNIFRRHPRLKKKGGCLKIGGGIALVVIFLVVLVNVIGGGGESASETPGSNSDSGVEAAAPAQPEMEVTATQLIDDLEANALGAANKYEGKVVKITGKFGTVDSSGKYFGIEGNQDFSLTNIQLDINESQKATVANFSKGQEVTVIGTVTDVGEIMGYDIKAHTIE